MSIDTEDGPRCANNGAAKRLDKCDNAEFNITQLRLQLRRNGFQPIPANGKSVYIKGWNTLTDVNSAMVQMWERMYRDHTNTGLLTRFTPALDIDILNEEAAEAVEWLVRERYGDDRVLVRIGLPPKRAIIFRTDKPFGKIVRSFDGGHKLEWLGSGQQVIAHGVHPDTRRPYEWHGAAPWSVRWRNLPFIAADAARRLFDDAEALLAFEFGLGRNEQTRASGGLHGHCSRQDLRNDIVIGRNLHEALTRLAASMLSAGDTPRDVQRHLFDLMDAPQAPRDTRWHDRRRSIPRYVRSALKFWREQPPPHLVIPDGPGVDRRTAS